MVLRDFELKWNQVTIAGIFNMKTGTQKTQKVKETKASFKRSKLIKKYFSLGNTLHAQSI